MRLPNIKCVLRQCHFHIVLRSLNFALLQLKKEKQEDGGERLHLELEAARPPWGTFNVTGSLLGWSFAEGLLQLDNQV